MAQRSKIFWLILFLIPVAWQLWVPPYTGLADNGDFAKVVGRFGLKPVDPGPQATFHFFNRLWNYDTGAVWVSPYWGVEVWLTRVALAIGGTSPFDIRWLGLVHAALFAGGAWLLITKRIAANAFAILALCDAAYVTYFQSFYFDAASILFLILLVAGWYAEEPWVLAVGGFGFALAKAPHAPLALVLGVLLLVTRKRKFLPAALLLICGGGYMLSQTKDEYKATAYYNLAFFKLAPMDAGSLDALRIRTEDRHLVGTHAFMPNSPAQQPAWLEKFFPQGGYGNAIRYYATHPGILARVLWSDLSKEASQIRAINLGNYERSTGVRYCTLSTTFGWYSAAKSWLFDHVPWFVFFVVPFCMWRTWRQPLAWALLATLGYEFAIASLADACETYRHLLLFHLAMDLLIWLALATESKQTQSL